MSLTNTKVADTYKSLLRFDKIAGGAGQNDDLSPLEDGSGQKLPIMISSRSGVDSGSGPQYTGIPSELDGAQIWIGNHPDEQNGGETGTFFVTLSSEHLEIGSRQALEISSEDEVDIFSLKKITFTGVLQLSGTRTNDTEDGVPLYTAQRVGDEPVLEGSMKELGSYTDESENLRNIDFCGNLTPQYNRTYTIGELARTMRGVYVGVGGTPSNKPKDIYEGTAPVPLKIGLDESEDTCLLTLNVATSGLQYRNPGLNTSETSDDEVLIQNIDTITRSTVASATFECGKTLTTEIDCTTSAAGQVLKLPAGPVGAMKIIVATGNNATALPIQQNDGGVPLTGAISISTGNSTKTYTFINTTGGWALTSSVE